MQRFVYAWTPESTPRYTLFSQDEGFRSKLYSFRVSSLCSGCESIGFREKKYVYVHAWTCAKLFGNEMCVSINGNNDSAIVVFFFLTQTHFDMQIFCKRINELVVFIIKALQCVISQPEHECVYIEECNVFSVLQRSKTNFSWNIKWIQFNMFSSNQIHLIQMFVNY